jgi:YD repeat-containing protein
MFDDRLALALTFTLAAAAAVEASPRSTRFVIGAQYRGFVKKTFPDIGNAGLTFAPEPAGGFRITGAGRVVHPQDKNRVYRLDFDMQFRVKGDHIDYLAVKNRFNDGCADLASTIERVLPFVYLVQLLPRLRVGGSRALTTPHGIYTMVYGGAGERVEVTLNQGRAQVGKFFLKSAMTGTSRLERFRIPGKDSVALNFISASQPASVVD